MDKFEKYVFSTKETTRFRFPTHVNDLVMNRSEAVTSEVFLVVLEPGEAPPLHLHPDTEQIFYMVQGKGTLRIGEQGAKQFPVVPGDVVRVPPHTFHSILCESPESIIYVSVDCFVNGRPEAEPTFEAHTRNLCKDNGWDYDEVYQPK